MNDFACRIIYLMLTTLLGVANKGLMKMDNKENGGFHTECGVFFGTDAENVQKCIESNILRRLQDQNILLTDMEDIQYIAQVFFEEMLNNGGLNVE